MAAFAAASTVGLWLPGRLAGAASGVRAQAWTLRAAGAMLAAASGWALGHGLWQRVADLCLSG